MLVILLLSGLSPHRDRRSINTVKTRISEHADDEVVVVVGAFNFNPSMDK